MLLEASSHHPNSLIQGIAVGQFLRIKRNCSQEEDFRAEATNMYARFKERGYSHKCIERARKRAINTDRRDLLATVHHSKKDTLQQAPIRIIMRFGSQWDQVKSILSHHWHILSRVPILGEIVRDQPLMTACRSQNLGDNLTHFEYQRSPSTNWLTDIPPFRGMYPCGSCTICKHVDKTDVFASSDGGRNTRLKVLSTAPLHVLFTY